jgi:hypothetical protein
VFAAQTSQGANQFKGVIFGGRYMRNISIMSPACHVTVTISHSDIGVYTTVQSGPPDRKFTSFAVISERDFLAPVADTLRFHDKPELSRPGVITSLRRRDGNEKSTRPTSHADSSSAKDTTFISRRESIVFIKCRRRGTTIVRIKRERDRIDRLFTDKLE